MVYRGQGEPLSGPAPLLQGVCPVTTMVYLKQSEPLSGPAPLLQGSLQSPQTLM